MRPYAPKALFRPFQRSWRSASSRAARTSRAPQSRQAAITRSAWASIPCWRPSSSMRRAAAASLGYPQPKASSTASMVVWSIISMAAGMRPRAITADTASGGLVDRVEDGEHRLHGLRLLENAHDDLGGDAEGALGADEEAGHVVALRLAGATAQPHDLAVGQDHLEAEHVVHRHPVLEGVRAAGVVRDIAADGAGLLARGIGRVVEALGSHRPREVEVDQARLDHGDLVVVVHLEHAVHPHQRDHEAALGGETSSREPRARAAGHEGQRFPVGELHDRPRPARRTRGRRRSPRGRGRGSARRTRRPAALRARRARAPLPSRPSSSRRRAFLRVGSRSPAMRGLYPQSSQGARRRWAARAAWARGGRGPARAPSAARRCCPRGRPRRRRRGPARGSLDWRDPPRRTSRICLPGGT